MLALDTLLAFLVLACTALCVALAVAKPAWVAPLLVLLAVMAAAFALCVRRFRRAAGRFLRAMDGAAASQSGLAALQVPVLAIEKGRAAWYNDAFLNALAGGAEVCLQPVERLLPQLDLAACAEPGGQDVRVGERRYTAYACETKGEEPGVTLVYFFEDTALKAQAEEYRASRPSVMILTVDTYDEILKELKESERARIVGAVEAALEQFIGTTTSFLRRVSAAKYVAVVEERHMREIVRARFSILDTVRAIGAGEDNANVTLSIGVGRGAPTLAEGEKMAAQALDMALGRGGDQAAVQTKDGFTFYGGVSQSVEKRSKVRSRIVAHAIRDLMAQAGDVFVMGHKMSDLDAVGAAVGMQRFARICGRQAYVVVDRERTLAGNLIDEFRAAGCEDFLTPEQAGARMTERTLLIVVDTHLPYLLESEALYRRAKNTVVIDHHRLCVGHIEDSVVFYHERYASSASELVSELLQYIDAPDKGVRLTALEAQGLLAGIMLDTRNFSLHTGVRTFEAAAFLRRAGAQTQAAKKLFNSTLDDYAHKAQLVTQAEMYRGVAVVCSKDLPPEMSVVIPQAANDLLTIDGVGASIVAVDIGSQISVSARSMGEVNVQVIMEKLGGGGHLTMAGAQLKGISVEQARQEILEAIDEYRDAQEQKTKKKNRA